MNDNKRLINDLSSMISTLCPEIDDNALSLRLEEISYNYDIQRKSYKEMENDLHEKIQIYLSSKKLEGLSQLTLEDYKIELRLFSNFIAKPTIQIHAGDIRSYLSSFDGIMTSTTAKKLSVLKSFFSWLVKEEMLLRDPTAKVKLPKIPKRLPKGLSIEELESVREACETHRQRALIEVFYSTACRLSELSGLNISDIDFQDMSAKVIGKGNKERVVYFSHKAVFHLKKYLDSRNDECDALFTTERRPIRRMKNYTIQQEINKIEQQVRLSKKLTPHTLRYTFGNLKMEAGIELADLQHLLGHSSPSTTLIYAEVSEERKRRAFKKFHAQ